VHNLAHSALAIDKVLQDATVLVSMCTRHVYKCALARPHLEALMP
jgi:hypothetical protein